MTRAAHGGDAGAAARSAIETRALLAVTLLGAGLRLLLFAQQRSLWMDEQLLALNVVTRSWAALLQPLAFEQVAPPLYLWSQRALWLLLGPDDRALRVLVLAAGIASVPALWWVARRWVGWPAATGAALLAAVSPVFVQYATEAKPYGIEPLVTLALVLAALRVIERPAELRRWLVLGSTGAAAILLATPAVFPLAGVGAALVSARAVRATAGGWRRLGGLAVVWGAVFLPVYALLYGPAAADPYMQRFWLWFRLQRQGGASGGAGNLLDWSLALSVFGNHGGDRATIAALAAMAILLPIGVIAVARRHGATMAMLLGAPIAVTLAAALAGRWVVTPRTTLFVAPLLCVLAAAALESVTAALVRQGASRGARTAGTRALAAMLLVLLLPAARSTLYLLRHPDDGEAPRPLVQAAVARAAAGEPVYLFARALPAWIIYATSWPRADSSHLALLLRTAAELGPNSGNGPARGRPVVPDEGCGRTLRSPVGVRSPLLVGLPTGMGPRVDGRASELPDDGWATIEAERIRAAARPAVSLFVTHARTDVREALLRGVRDAGGTVTSTVAAGTSRLYRVRFAPANAGFARTADDSSTCSTRTPSSPRS